MRSQHVQPPRDYIATGTWPHGQLQPDAPTGVRAVQIITRRLRQHMDTRSLSARAVEAATGVGRKVIDRLLHGDTIPDAGTVARLEIGLAERLWPDDLTYAAHQAADARPEAD